MASHAQQSAYPNLKDDIRKLLQGHGVTDISELEAALRTQYRDITRFHLAQVLRRLAEDRLVQRDGDMVRWINDPTPNGVRPYRDDAGAAQEVHTPRKEQIEQRPPTRIRLPEFQKQRSGHLVTIEVAPEEYQDVVQIQLKINGQWFNVPFNAPVRFCFGDNIPKWTPAQEINLGLSAIRLVYADGSFDEREGLNPNEQFTMAFA